LGILASLKNECSDQNTIVNIKRSIFSTRKNLEMYNSILKFQEKFTDKVPDPKRPVGPDTYLDPK
jgi:hypothetical protein